MIFLLPSGGVKRYISIISMGRAPTGGVLPNIVVGFLPHQQGCRNKGVGGGLCSKKVFYSC